NDLPLKNMSRSTKILRKKIPTERLLLIDFINFARKKNHIQIHCSFEITRLEEIFYNLKLKSKDVSKTAYFVYCLTQILKKYPSLRTYYYKKTSYCFDEIDILVPMEFKHQVLDKKVPVGIILRDLENKSYMNIMNEIREIQKMKLNEIEIVKKGEHL
ncbi:MAG: hypothetical protein ORN85_01445, partial [Sediminibacterium sp.]|nr:hypothetical protein [Sediminibacterium sp.]